MTRKLFFWFQKGAHEGDSTSQFALGSCYRYGTGIEKNFEHARRWYGEAKISNDSAKYHLGVMMVKGEGGPRDFSGEMDLLQEAAENDLTLAKLTIERIMAALP